MLEVYHRFDGCQVGVVIYLLPIGGVKSVKVGFQERWGLTDKGLLHMGPQKSKARPGGSHACVRAYVRRRKRGHGRAIR